VNNPTALVKSEEEKNFGSENLENKSETQKSANKQLEILFSFVRILFKFGEW
jgi:hypothetical protein